MTEIEVPGNWNLDLIRQLALAQGARVLDGRSCLWVEKRKLFWESVPPHRRIQLQKREAARIFLSGAAAIRYTCDEGEAESLSSFEYVCADKNFGFGSIPDLEARRQVRRGLEACHIRRVDCEELAEDGYAINQSVFTRQRRVVDSFMSDPTKWRNYVKACALLRNIETYGAFVDGRLLGHSFGVYVDDYCYLMHTHAYGESMKLNPVKALLFTVMKAAFEKAGVNYVSFGLDSFLPLPKVDHFKVSMGFQKRRLHRRLIVNPLARPAFCAPGAWLVEKVLSRTHPGLIDDFSTFTRALREQRRSSGIAFAPATENRPGSDQAGTSLSDNRTSLIDRDTGTVATKASVDEH